MATGKVIQIIGPVVDVEFPPEQLPDIYNAVEIPLDDAQRRRRPGDHAHRRGPAAPRQQLGALRGDGHAPTACGAASTRVDTGAPDHGAGRPGDARARSSTCWASRSTSGGAGRRPTPTTRSTARRRASRSRRPQPEIFETGIKVIDLIAPFRKGGKIGVFGGAGVGKTVIITGADQQHRQASTAATRCSPAWASAPARATTSGSR